MIKPDEMIVERMISPNGSKPRILILAENMGTGGMERQIIELLKGIKNRGHYSMVMAVLDQGGGREAEARSFADIYLSLPRRSRFDISPAYALMRQIRPLAVQLIHTYGWISGMTGLAAAKLMRLPVINGGFREAPSNLGVREKVNRWCALRSDMIVANAQACLDSYGLTNHPRAKVIYNGMDFGRFSLGTQEEQGQKTICMVANFGPHKDHLTMVEAFRQVRNLTPDSDYQLVLVGHDIGTLEVVRKRVTALGLADHVQFVTDCLHPESIIARSEIGVLSSFYGEGISNSLLETMFLSKPVIATDAGGNQELIQNGKTGILVKKQSPEALAEAILFLLTQPELAREMGAAGQKFVREHFALDRMVGEYEELYACLLSYRFAKHTHG